MKVFAHHDLDGQLSSLVAVDASAHAGLMLTPEPGVLVSEVKGMKIKAGEKGLEDMQEIARTHALTSPKQLGTLTKRN
jgi:hypothetical protein